MIPIVHVAGLLLAALSAPTSPTPQPSTAPTPAITLELGTSSEQLSNGRGTWQSTYATASERLAPRKVAYLTVADDRRFGYADSDYTAGFYTPPSANTILNLEVSYSPTHAVLPQSELVASLDHRLADGWGYTLGLGERHYSSTDVQLGSVLIDRYWKAYRAMYSVTASHISNVAGTSVGHSASLTYYYGVGQDSSVSGGVNAGREADNVGNAVIASAVWGAHVNGVHWFTPRWAVAWLASTLRQGAFYTRSGVRAGVRLRL